MPSAKNKVQPQKKSHEHELDTKGVYQLTNGTWAFRFCKSVKGKNVYKRASTDSKGNPLLTQRDAILAREEAMMLCNQMGHASIKVTQQYYIAISQGGINALQKNIDLL